MYFLPHFRFTSFAVGIIFGVILRKFEDFKLTKLQRNIGNVLAVFCGAAAGQIIVWNWEFTFIAQGETRNILNELII